MKITGRATWRTEPTTTTPNCSGSEASAWSSNEVPVHQLTQLVGREAL